MNTQTFIVAVEMPATTAVIVDCAVFPPPFQPIKQLVRSSICDQARFLVLNQEVSSLSLRYSPEATAWGFMLLWTRYGTRACRCCRSLMWSNGSFPPVTWE